MNRAAPCFLIVRNGIMRPDRMAIMGWLLDLARDGRPWGWVPWLLSELPMAVVNLVRRAILRILGMRDSAVVSARRAIKHGWSVAIWTPPGEWRVARTLADLEQIIADGGEIEPPQDAD